MTTRIYIGERIPWDQISRYLPYLFGQKSSLPAIIHPQFNFMQEQHSTGQSPKSDSELELQKEYKASKERFRIAIKGLADFQSTLRNQRKTVKLKGERGIPADIAAAKHATQRRLLRHLYMSYAIMRQAFGGYTKFPILGADLLNNKAHIVGINNDLLKDLLAQYGPKIIGM